jgi:hypothetical protein
LRSPSLESGKNVDSNKTLYLVLLAFVSLSFVKKEYFTILDVLDLLEITGLLKL